MANMHPLNSLFQSFFESMEVGIRITDSEGAIVAVNEAYCKLYGYSREELSGKVFTLVLPPEQQVKALNLYRKHFEQEEGGIFRGNRKGVRKDGSIIWLTIKSFNMLADDGIRYRVSMIQEVNKEVQDFGSEIFHASVLKNVKDSIVTVSLGGEILYWNHGAEQLFGFNAAELQGKDIGHFVPAFMPGQFIKYFSDGNIFKEIRELEYRAPGDVSKYINLSISPLRDEFEALIGLIFVGQDITEEFKAKQEIYEQRNQLASIVESQSNFLIRLNAEGAYSYINHSFLRHLGYSDLILGKPFSVHISASHVEDWNEIYSQLLNGKEVQRIELKMLQADGEEIWTSWEFVPLPGETGKITGLQAVGVDITERKKAEQERDHMLSRYQALNEELQANEEELRQNLEKTVELNEFIQKREQKFKSLLENSFEAILQYDEGGIIHYASPSVATTLGYSAEEMVGTKGMSYIHPDDKEQTRALLAKMMEKAGNRVYILQRVRRKDGRYIWTESYTTNLLYDENVKGVVSNFHDISERIESEERIRTREASLTIAQHIAKLGSAEFDLVEGTVAHSSGIYAIYDYEPGENADEEFVGYEYLHPEDMEKMKKVFRSPDGFGPDWIKKIALLPEEAMQEIEGNAEYRILSAAGKLKHIRCRSRFIRDSAGKAVKLIMVFQDITEEKHLQLLIDETSRISRIGSWELDVRNNKVFWTPETYRLFGISPDEELSIEKAVGFYHPQDQARLVKAFEELTTKGTPFDLELKMNTAQDKCRWVRLMGTGEKVKNQVLFAKGTMQDITNQKESEEEILKYAERLRLATEAAGIGIFDWDLVQNRLLWDAQMLKIYGIQKVMEGDVVEVNYEEWKNCIHPEDASRTPESLEISLKHDKLDQEYRLLLKSGEIKWVKSYGYVFRDEAKQPLRMIGVNFDISPLKHTEESLRQNNQELNKINQELDHFVYSTSHNLRAPLTSILGLVGLIKHHYRPEEHQQYIKLIEKSVEKLDETIQEITNYSRNTRMEVALEPVDFDLLIQGVIDSLSYIEQAGKIKISYITPAGLQFYSDSSRLKMILTNLLSNGIKYYDERKDQPFIHIEIVQESKGVKMCIQDNGIGIAQEHLDRIFNMFYRASSKSTGSGLGLYIVKEAVHKLEGTLEVNSSPGEGTRFTIFLPNLI